MALASRADVETRLGRDLTDDELDLLPGLLEEASLLVEGYLGVHYAQPEDVPDAVRVVTSRVVARALTAGTEVQEGATAMTLQTLDFSRTSSFGEGRSSLFLSKQDKLMLRPLMSGFVSIQLQSERG